MILMGLCIILGLFRESNKTKHFSFLVRGFCNLLDMVMLV